MQDVQIVLDEARIQYEGKGRSKASRWLAALSERVMCYGQVLDMLVQHHPEYVSLAWGAFKFVFQVGGHH